MNATIDAYETSLSKLSEHDWNVLRNTWARGIDWYVCKVGSKWTLSRVFPGAWPLYKTKKAAGEAADNLICAEARWRAANRKEGV